MATNEEIEGATDRTMAYKDKFIKLVTDPSIQEMGSPLELVLGMSYALGVFITAAAVVEGTENGRPLVENIDKLKGACLGLLGKAIEQGTAACRTDMRCANDSIF